MSEGFVTVRMSDLSSIEAYELLSAVVVPRPIAFVSTLSAGGRPNLAPFSFFMVGGSNPPSLMYSATLNKNGEPKDSLRNALETREFVVNSVHREMAVAMHAWSSEFPSELSEWEVCGFTPLPSVEVGPPRVAESQVQFECRLFEVLEHGTGADAARYVVGEVVYAHVSQAIASLPASIRPISRLGARDYADLSRLEIFQLPR